MPVNVLQYRVTETWLKKSGFYVYTASYKAAGSQTFRDLWCGFQMVSRMCSLDDEVSRICCGFQSMLWFLEYVVVSRLCCGFQIVSLWFPDIAVVVSSWLFVSRQCRCFLDGAMVSRWCLWGFQFVSLFLDGAMVTRWRRRSFKMVLWFLDDGVFQKTSRFQMVFWFLDIVVVSRWCCGFRWSHFG